MIKGQQIYVLMIAIITGILIYFVAAHAVTAYETSPDVRQEIQLEHSERFYIQKTHTYGRDCRYNLFVEDGTKLNRIGYIKHHCNYKPGDKFILSIASEQ